MTIRKIANRTTSLAVSASTTQTGIFKSVAQQFSSIKHLENLSSTLIPKLANVSAKLIERLLYDTDGFGTRYLFDYVFLDQRPRLNFNKSLADGLVGLDSILLSTIRNRQPLDNLSVDEAIAFLLRTARTFTDSAGTISQPAKLFLKAPINEVQDFFDNFSIIRVKTFFDDVYATDEFSRTIAVNRTIDDSVGTVDAFTSIDGSTYSLNRTIREFLTVGSEATAVRNSGDVLENVSFVIDKVLDPDMELLDVLAIGFEKGLANDQIIAELRAFYATKLAQDDVAQTDVNVIWYNKQNFDSLDLAEIIVQSFDKSLADTATMLDSMDLGDRLIYTESKLLNEFLTGLDRPALLVTKPLIDEQQLLEAFSTQPIKATQDTATGTDETVKFIDKLSTDYLNFLDILSILRSRTFDDSQSIFDLKSFMVKQTLQDLVTADDPLVRLGDGALFYNIIQKQDTTTANDYFARRLEFYRYPHHGFLSPTTIAQRRSNFYNLTAKTGAYTYLPILRTNLIAYSEQFDLGSYWTSTGISVNSNVTAAPSNVVVSPSPTYDAGQVLENFYNQPNNPYADNWYQLAPTRWVASSDGDLLVASSSYSVHNIVTPNILNLTVTENFAFAVYVKYAGQRYIRISCTVDVWADFDLVTNSIVDKTASKASIQSVGDGWYLCEIANRVISFGAAPELQILQQILLNSMNESYGTDFIALVPEDANQKVQISLLDDSRNPSFTGSGTSGVIVWGAQLEVGPTVEQEVSSLFYIRTYGAPATRIGFNVMPQDTERLYIQENFLIGFSTNRVFADQQDLLEDFIQSTLYLRGAGSGPDEPQFTDLALVTENIIRGLVFNRTFNEATLLGNGLAALRQSGDALENLSFWLNKTPRAETVSFGDVIKSVLGYNKYPADSLSVGLDIDGRYSGSTQERIRFIILTRVNPGNPDLTPALDLRYNWMNKTAKQGVNNTVSGTTVTASSPDRLFVGQQYGTIRFARDPMENISFIMLRDGLPYLDSFTQLDRPFLSLRKLLSDDVTMIDAFSFGDNFTYFANILERDVQIMGFGTTSQLVRWSGSQLENISFITQLRARAGLQTTVSGTTNTASSGDRLFVGQQYGTTRFSADPMERLGFYVALLTKTGLTYAVSGTTVTAGDITHPVFVGQQWGNIRQAGDPQERLGFLLLNRANPGNPDLVPALDSGDYFWMNKDAKASIPRLQGNLVQYSEDFTNAVWTKATGVFISSNVVVAPDGNTTADRIGYNGSETLGQFLPKVYAYWAYTSATAGIVGETYTASIWLRADTSAVVRLDIGNDTPTTCNLSSTWRRFTQSSTVSFPILRIIADGTNNTSFGIYAWGAQINQGRRAEPYLQTTATAVLTSYNTAADRDRVFAGTYQTGRKVAGDTLENFSYLNNLAAARGTDPNLTTAGLVPYNLWPYPTSLYYAVSSVTSSMSEGTSSLVGQTPLVIASTTSTSFTFNPSIRIYVKPSTTYNFSIYVQPIENDLQVRLTAATYTSSDVLIGSFLPAYVTSTVNTWTRVNHIAITGATAAYVTLGFARTGTTGAVILDGLQISEGSGAVPLQTRLRGYGTSSETVSIIDLKRIQDSTSIAEEVRKFFNGEEIYGGFISKVFADTASMSDYIARVFNAIRGPQDGFADNLTIGSPFGLRVSGTSSETVALFVNKPSADAFRAGTTGTGIRTSGSDLENIRFLVGLNEPYDTTTPADTFVSQATLGKLLFDTLLIGTSSFGTRVSGLGTENISFLIDKQANPWPSFDRTTAGLIRTNLFLYPMDPYAAITSTALTTYSRNNSVQLYSDIPSVEFTPSVTSNAYINFSILNPTSSRSMNARVWLYATTTGKCSVTFLRSGAGNGNINSFDANTWNLVTASQASIGVVADELQIQISSQSSLGTYYIGGIQVNNNASLSLGLQTLQRGYGGTSETLTIRFNSARAEVVGIGENVVRYLNGILIFPSVITSETITITDFFARVFNVIRGPQDGYADFLTIGSPFGSRVSGTSSENISIWMNKPAPPKTYTSVSTSWFAVVDPMPSTQITSTALTSAWRSAVIGTDGSIYVGGVAFNNGSGVVAKYSSTGSRTWIRNLVSGSVGSIPTWVDHLQLDSSESLVMSGATSLDAFIGKFDTSGGTFYWSVRQAITNGWLFGCTVLGNSIYAIGEEGNTSSASYTLSSAISGNGVLSGTVYNYLSAAQALGNRSYNITADVNNTLISVGHYWTGTTVTSTIGHFGLISEATSGLAVVASRRIGRSNATTASTVLKDIYVDSSNSRIILGFGWNLISPTSSSDCFIAKLTSSYTIQWATAIGTDQQNNVLHKLGTDDLGNYYVGISDYNSASATVSWVYKINDSGSVVWAKQINGMNYIGDIVANSSSVYVVGSGQFSIAGLYNSATKPYSLIVRLPADNILADGILVNSANGTTIAIDSNFIPSPTSITALLTSVAITTFGNGFVGGRGPITPVATANTPTVSHSGSGLSDEVIIDNNSITAGHAFGLRVSGSSSENTKFFINAIKTETSTISDTSLARLILGRNPFDNLLIGTSSFGTRVSGLGTENTSFFMGLVPGNTFYSSITLTTSSWVVTAKENISSTTYYTSLRSAISQINSIDIDSSGTVHAVGTIEGTTANTDWGKHVWISNTGTVLRYQTISTFNDTVWTNVSFNHTANCIVISGTVSGNGFIWVKNTSTGVMLNVIQGISSLGTNSAYIPHIDTAGSIYSQFSNFSATPNTSTFVKYSVTGSALTLLWTSNITTVNTGFYVGIFQMLQKPTGEMLGLGYMANNAGTLFSSTLVSLNSSTGFINHVSSLLFTATTAVQIRAGHAFADGSLILAGQAINLVSSNGGLCGFICKLDSSNTINWAWAAGQNLSVNPAATSLNISSQIHVDSSNNIYVAYSNGIFSGYKQNYAWVYSYDSSGTVLWARALRINSATGNSGLQGLRVDNQHIYLGFATQTGAAVAGDSVSSRLAVAKFPKDGSGVYDLTLNGAGDFNTDFEWTSSIGLVHTSVLARASMTSITNRFLINAGGTGVGLSVSGYFTNQNLNTTPDQRFTETIPYQTSNLSTVIIGDPNATGQRNQTTGETLVFTIGSAKRENIDIGENVVRYLNGILVFPSVTTSETITITDFYARVFNAIRTTSDTQTVGLVPYNRYSYPQDPFLHTNFTTQRTPGLAGPTGQGIPTRLFGVTYTYFNQTTSATINPTSLVVSAWVYASSTATSTGIISIGASKEFFNGSNGGSDSAWTVTANTWSRIFFTENINSSTTKSARMFLRTFTSNITVYVADIQLEFNASSPSALQNRQRAYGSTSENISIQANKSVPALLGKPSGSWISNFDYGFGNNAAYHYHNDAVVDTQGNVYVSVLDNYWGIANIVKYNSSGTVVWYNKTTRDGIDSRWRGLALTSSGGVLAVGYEREQAALAIFNSSNGTLVTSSLHVVSNDFTPWYGVTVDTSTTNIYVWGQASTVTGNYTIARFNSSLSLVWCVTPFDVNIGSRIIVNDICIPQTSALVVAGYYNPNSSSALTSVGLIFKQNSSTGAIFDSYTLDLSNRSQSFLITNIASDAADNLYISGRASTLITSNTGRFADGFLAKINSSNTLVWALAIGESSSTRSAQISDICLDSSNNIYVLSYGSYDTGTAVLYKFDTSGNTVWSNNLIAPWGISSTRYPDKISTDGTHVYFGYENTYYNYTLGAETNRTAMLIKVRCDGTDTGIFRDSNGINTITYSPTSPFIVTSILQRLTYAATSVVAVANVPNEFTGTLTRAITTDTTISSFALVYNSINTDVNIVTLGHGATSETIRNNRSRLENTRFLINKQMIKGGTSIFSGNLITYSEDFTTASTLTRTNVFISSNVIEAPVAGFTSASTFTMYTSSYTYLKQLTISSSNSILLGSGRITLSGYVKNVSRATSLYIGCNLSRNYGSGVLTQLTIPYNFSSGTVNFGARNWNSIVEGAETASLVSAGSDWYRFSQSWNASLPRDYNQLSFTINDTDAGTTTTSNPLQFHIWGLQVSVENSGNSGQAIDYVQTTSNQIVTYFAPDWGSEVVNATDVFNKLLAQGRSDTITITDITTRSARKATSDSFGAGVRYYTTSDTTLSAGQLLELFYNEPGSVYGTAWYDETTRSYRIYNVRDEYEYLNLLLLKRTRGDAVSLTENVDRYLNGNLIDEGSLAGDYQILTGTAIDLQTDTGSEDLQI